MKFMPVEPEEVSNLQEAARGRVTYPIIKGFMEQGKKLLQLDTSEYFQPASRLAMYLGNYVRNKGLPIKIFMRTGKLYMMRLDINEDGSLVEQEPQETSQPQAITVEVIKEHVSGKKGFK